MKIMDRFIPIFPQDVKKFHVCGKNWDNDGIEKILKVIRQAEKFETVAHFEERATEKNIQKTPAEVLRNGKVFEYKMYQDFLFRVAVRLHSEGEQQDTIMVFQPSFRGNQMIVRCITAYKNNAMDNHSTLNKSAYC